MFQVTNCDVDCLTEWNAMRGRILNGFANVTNRATNRDVDCLIECNAMCSGILNGFANVYFSNCELSIEMCIDDIDNETIVVTLH